MSKRKPIIRLMVPDGLAIPLDGFAVCHGDPVVPARRCLWMVDSFHTTARSADRRYAELGQRSGRAVVHLDYDQVRLVSTDGKTVTDLRDVRGVLS